MQILKSEVQKSVTVQHILNDTNSMCFVYYEQPLQFEHFWIDSREYTHDDLKECIMSNIPTKQCDYLIIYTNQPEIEIQGLVGWLDYNSHKFNCNEIIVTCRK